VDSFATFGDLLRYLRRRARLTQRELGIAVRYSESQIARLEANQRLPDVTAVQSLFIDALQLRDEPETVSRLVELAESAHDEGFTPATPSGLRPSSARLTRFIGRERDVSEVNRLLSANRLVTLTGTGGVGKTRLAVEVAVAFMERQPGATTSFSDGVWIAELASITDQAAVVRSVAAVFDLAGRPGRTGIHALITYLRDKHLLLVLDNCEHLVAACAELVETLLGACPSLYILATSREPLRAAGEVVWRLSPLATPALDELPDAQDILSYDAVQLFIENASAAQPGFHPTPDELPTVARICCMLDGIPLALEMAAAQVPALSVSDIAASLEKTFSLLTSGRRTALPRQQTLRATLDWSYALLSNSEQVLLARLSVFAGNLTAEAARIVCADDVAPPVQLTHPGHKVHTVPATPLAIRPDDVAPLLAQLVHKSVVTTAEIDGEKRYRLLQTVRQYAMEQLEAFGEANHVRLRHAAYLVQKYEKADTHWPALEEIRWYRRLEADYNDLRATLAWCLSPAGDAVLGLRLAVALAGFWQYRGWLWRAPGWLGEGRDLMEAALSNALEAPFELKAVAMLCLSFMQDTCESAKSMAEECLVLCRQMEDESYIAAALSNLGQIEAWAHDYGRAEWLMQEALALYRELKLDAHVAGVLTYLGHAYLDHGKFESAAQVLEESLQIWRSKNVAWSNLGGIARSLLWLGRSIQLLGDDQRAMQLHNESLGLYREAGDRNGAGYDLVYLGEAYINLGTPRQAVSYFREALGLFAQSEDATGLAVSLAGLAAIMDTQGHVLIATRLAGAAAVFGERQAVQWQLGLSERVHYDRVLAAARSRFDVPDMAAAWAEGQHMSLKQVLEEASSVTDI
jgi:non-specific serine/threonine protein kinase